MQRQQKTERIAMTGPAESPFVLKIEDDAIVSLQYRDDAHPTEYIKPG